jgi:cysteinyl-tRNA synthetase
LINAPNGIWTHDELVARIAEYRDYKPPLINDPKPSDIASEFDEYLSSDLNTALGLTALEELLGMKKLNPEAKLTIVSALDSVLGLDLLNLTRADLRIRPKDAQITEAEIEDALARRKAARAEKDFATSDAIRDELAAKGVEVMDGDPLGWEWKPQ